MGWPGDFHEACAPEDPRNPTALTIATANCAVQLGRIADALDQQAASGSAVLRGPSWDTTLRCRYCSTVIRYVDQVPPWTPDPRIAVDLKHGAGLVGLVIPDVFLGLTPPPEVEAFQRFAHVLQYDERGRLTGVRFDNRCVPCPSCAESVFVQDGIVVL